MKVGSWSNNGYEPLRQLSAKAFIPATIWSAALHMRSFVRILTVGYMGLFVRVPTVRHRILKVLLVSIASTCSMVR